MPYFQEDKIFIGCSIDASQQTPVPHYLLLKWANRHGLIAGATGTGKTVTLQTLAEGFSNAGIPVFMADIKGDLSGLCQPSAQEPFLMERADAIGFKPEFQPTAFPVTFWDVFGKNGHPIRTTISEIGALLLARMLELNDVQEAVLNICFRYADDQGLLLLDLKDLRALLSFVSEKREELTARYGNISLSSIGAIQRALLQLEEQGAELFLGEPALELGDLMRQDKEGRGIINIFAAHSLMQSPRLYATFLLWLLSELFEELPEVGDSEKPKLVFFFDEAHLLFQDAPKMLLEKVEQVIRLIRSKGVGVYFITQNPADIPDTVLGQLGNRVQHALRAFTPAQQKTIRAAAESYPANPAFAVEEVITQLAVGEALLSVLQNNNGQPSMVERVLVRPPSSRVGIIPQEVIKHHIYQNSLHTKYAEMVDRQSAYEMLQAKTFRDATTPDERNQTITHNTRSTMADQVITSVVRSVSSQLGRAIAREVVRGILGSIRRR